MCSEITSENTYKVFCVKEAHDEWDNLDESIKEQFKGKLRELVQNPDIPSKRLHSPLNGYYKIILKRAGYRLVYEIIKDRIVLLVWTVGKRKESEVYKTAQKRLKNYKGLDDDMVEIQIN